MSSFRRAPNVSQYIANLNNISPAESSPPDNFINDDLDLFATTDFIDFDMGETISNLPITSADLSSPINITQSVAQNNLGFDQAQTGQDWSNDFNFQTDFSNFQSPLLDNTSTFPLQTTIKAPAAPAPSTGEKRKLSETTNIPTTGNTTAAQQSATAPPLGEDARVAAEEDKRRRNTAASARFRIKKKQREAELETRAKEMTDKAAMLETKVSQLEMENRWLKSLITERDAGAFKGEGEASLEGMWRKFESENSAASSLDGSKDGVGTAAKKQKLEV